uniref:Reticulon n=2 Tax=Mastacembelus armatus TaxID=205130 RepID=A0A3Q3MK58_9TELE
MNVERKVTMPTTVTATAAGAGGAGPDPVAGITPVAGVTAGAQGRGPGPGPGPGQGPGPGPSLLVALVQSLHEDLPQPGGPGPDPGPGQCPGLGLEAEAGLDQWAALALDLELEVAQPRAVLLQTDAQLKVFLCSWFSPLLTFEQHINYRASTELSSLTCLTKYITLLTPTGSVTAASCCLATPPAYVPQPVLTSRRRFKAAEKFQSCRQKMKMADRTGSNSSESSSSNSSSSSLRDLAHSALQLIHWKQPKKSAAAFGLSLLVLVSVATLSIISVMSYLLLAFLCVTITFRVYKSVIQAIQKSDDGHPFRSMLERDISVSSESVRQLADQSLIHLNWFSSQTRRLLLVEDLVDSLKLAAVMWVMTYVGAVFNGVTILILADIIFFTTPLIYKKKKIQIDRHIELVRSTVEETLQKMQDKLPGAVKRTKAE